MQSTAQINHQTHLSLNVKGLSDISYNKQAVGQTEHSVSTGNDLFRNQSSFLYNNRLRVAFMIGEGYRGDFVMIRGLLEFHRPKDFSIIYDRQARSITIDAAQSRIEALQEFLEFVQHSLDKEKRFRHALKIAIEFESRYRAERESIYDLLQNSARVQA